MSVTQTVGVVWPRSRVEVVPKSRQPDFGAGDAVT